MLVSSFYYVYENSHVDELVDELAYNEDIFALAVVDSDMKVCGVIIRKDLFDVLGRRFGRELYYKKNVREVMRNIVTMHHNVHIFECAKIIEKDLLSGTQEYYALVDERNCYKGIFSTKDMLIFLSRLTQLDIEHAKRVINRLINKEHLIRTKRLTIAIRTDMVQDIGGDFYHVVSLKNKNRHIVILGDVSGKGIAASMITTLINGMITIYDFDNNDIEGFIKHLNDYIFFTFECEKFVTMAVVIIDEDNELLTMYDFGHSFSYIYRNGSIFKLSLKEINLPIGVQKIENMNFGSIKLEKDDRIIILTDGCLEQRNGDSEEYGINRFKGILLNINSIDTMKIVNSLISDIHSFRKLYPQQDDMTIACIRYS